MVCAYNQETEFACTSHDGARGRGRPKELRLKSDISGGEYVTHQSSSMFDKSYDDDFSLTSPS